MKSTFRVHGCCRVVVAAVVCGLVLTGPASGQCAPEILGAVNTPDNALGVAPDSARSVTTSPSVGPRPVAVDGVDTVVLPPAAAGVEGANDEGTALGFFSNTAQIVYGADLLAEAGIEAGDKITGLAFRLSADRSAPVWSVPDYQIRLATSLNPPGGLDPNFVNNRGADYTVVRNGPLAYDGSEYPTGGSPNGFGPIIDFQRSFTYAGGDLLLEYTHTFVESGGSFADAEEPDPRMQSQFAPGYNGTIEGFGGQGVDRGTVVQLTVERGCPEDLDDSGAVDFGDILAILSAWGNKGGPEDLDGSGFVDFGDILSVLTEWGACPGTTGACCFEDSTCLDDMTEGSCASMGGAYQGNRSTCAGTCLGACCFEDGTCLEATIESDCVAMGGFYRGGGSTCAIDCVGGACCFDDGTCVDEVTVEACGTMGGAYQGDGTICLDACLGACCLEDGTCETDTAERDCVNMGGAYQGNRTTCAGGCGPADDCADPPAVSEGAYFYSTLEATTDGPTLPEECDEGNGVRCRKDVWIRYIASCTGTATASVCDSDFDTRIVVYEDGDCPGPFLACNDDACGADGTRSEVSFPVQSGGTYLIRIGSPRFGTGEGTLVIDCAE